MDLNTKYQIFISSTYTDLRNARSKVTETILAMYQFPIGMEMFSAGDDDQWTVIKRTIDISDYYILIVGHRYGSVTEEGLSYTEKEYNYAREKGIPILSFIRNRDVATIPSERESNPLMQEKLEAFVQKAMGSKVCEFWNNDEDLAAKIPIALVKQFSTNPGVGWVRRDANLNKDYTYRGKATLEDHMVNYLEDRERQGLEKVTLYNYQIELKIFLEFSKEINMMDINASHIKEYLRFREDNYRLKSKRSLERTRGILRVFFEWLIEERIIENNPVKKVKPYRFLPVEVEELTVNEIAEIKKACHTNRERALVEVLLSTGCYLNEIGGIVLDDINWDKKIIKINGVGRRSRLVIFSEEAKKSLLQYLKQRKGESDYLFIGERRPFRNLTDRAFQREIRKIVSRTAISKNITATVFRHTFAWNMLEEGYPVNVIQTLLGNAENRITSETSVRLTEENIDRIEEFRK